MQLTVKFNKLADVTISFKTTRTDTSVLLLFVHKDTLGIGMAMQAIARTNCNHLKNNEKIY